MGLDFFGVEILKTFTSEGNCSLSKVSINVEGVEDSALDSPWDIYLCCVLSVCVNEINLTSFCLAVCFTFCRRL